MSSTSSSCRRRPSSQELKCFGLDLSAFVLVLFACAGLAGCGSTTPSMSAPADSSAPTINSFAASPGSINAAVPESINSGSSSTLSWSTSGATSIAITPGTFTSTSASGSTGVSPTATTTYTLTATNTAGSVTSTQTVTVNAGSEPTISSFTASPTSINSGSSNTLSWSTSGAASIAITPGTFTSTSASGSTGVSPTATTTYTLTATNTAGSVTSTQTVTVNTSTEPTISATWYISTTGSDSNGGTSPSTAFATFTHALAAMAGCDTLIVESGYYYDQITPQASNSGNVSSSGCYTTIEAATTWGVTVDTSTQPSTSYISSLNIGAGVSYVDVYGIKFAGNLANTYSTGPVFIEGNHIKLQKTAGYNAPCAATAGSAWNVANYTVTNASYILIEDSYAWGCGRYKFEDYQSDHVIFRHDVARNDYAGDGTGTATMDQCAGFVQYSAGPAIMQNDIYLDSGTVGNTTGGMYGGIWVPNDDPIDSSGTYEGDIILNVNTVGGAIYDPALTGGSGGVRIINNVAIVNATAGYLGDRQNPYWTTTSVSLLIDHLTEVNIFGPSIGSGNWASGVGSLDMSNNNFTQQLTENSVIEDMNVFGMSGYMTSNYNIFWNNPANFGTVSYLGPLPTAGANDRLSTNPGLLYPVRVEPGTPGYGTASDGGNVGATILYRIGTPGTMWGDTGYDTLTSISLWPWSDEATIKTDMASFSMVNPVYGGTISGARGFAATGNGLYGGPITLTSYIWEALGNACPDTICQ